MPIAKLNLLSIKNWQMKYFHLYIKYKINTFYRQDLEKLDIGKMALHPLDFHIKDFSVKHARCVLEEQDLMHENRRLENQLDELLQNNPEIALRVKEQLAFEHSKQLEETLQQLNLQNHKSAGLELEQDKLLKKISTLNKELVSNYYLSFIVETGEIYLIFQGELRMSIMKGVSTLESLSIHQQTLLDEVHGGGQSSKDFDKMLEIEGQLLLLMKKLYSMPSVSAPLE
jgi:hypothetical protein